MRETDAKLPGFDHDHYTDHLQLDHIDLPKLVGEFMTVRLSTISMYENIRPELLQRTGQANGI